MGHGYHVHACVDMLHLWSAHAYASVGMALGADYLML